MGVALRLRAPNFTASSLQRLSPSAQRVSSSSLLRPASLPAALWQLPSLPLTCRSKRADAVIVRAADGAEPGSVKQEEVDSHVGQYCSLKEKGGKRTLGELEAEFLEALQSFYYEGKPMMSNEEFDLLKEELMWEGSKVIMLSSDEQRFMEASLAYQAGKPILSDVEYDTLKRKLKKGSSIVAIEGPRCSLRSRKVVSDSTVDYLKMTLLNLPAVLVALGLYARFTMKKDPTVATSDEHQILVEVFFLDDVTGFEITYLLELPEPYSFLFTWFVVLPTTFLIARSLTNIIVKDALILKGPCPNCGADTTSFFGTILTVESGGTVNNVKCEPCGAKLLYDKETRLIELDSPPEPPKEKKVPAKKPVAESVS